MADSERANSQPEHDGQLQETRSSAELSDNWWAALYQAALGEGDPRVRRQRIDEAQKAILRRVQELPPEPNVAKDERRLLTALQELTALGESSRKQ